MIDVLVMQTATCALVASGLSLMLGSIYRPLRRAAGRFFIVACMILACELATSAVVPFVQPSLAYLVAHWWLLLVPLLLISPVLVVVLGVGLWVGMLTALFGGAGTRAGGVHLVRFFDWLFRRRPGRPIPHPERPDDESVLNV